MPRKPKYPESPVAGRPPKHPLEKVGRPVRALVTPPVMGLIELACKELDLNLSEFLRLAVYERLRRQTLDEEGTVVEDPTFETLRQKGLL